MSLRTSIVLIALAVVACDDDDKKGNTDTSVSTTTAPDTSESDTNVETDTTVADDTTTSPEDTTTSDDTSVADTGVADTSEPEDTTKPDTSEPDPIAAVKGARCALNARVALVEIDGSFGSLNVNGQIYDRPNPLIGEPKLTDQSCQFWQFEPAPCPADCPDDTVCGLEGTCVPAQSGVNATLTLSDGVSEQTFTSDDGTGNVYGSPTLEGRTLSAELHFGNQRVTTDATAIPADLGDTTGAMTVLDNDSRHPQHLTINWTAPSAIIGVPQIDSSVFTHIPINHHAGAPTFTECQVGAGMGQLDVDGSMLEPLAVITGLEFQGIVHVRFAAADTAEGCVEFRWFVQEYPSITEENVAPN